MKFKCIFQDNVTFSSLFKFLGINIYIYIYPKNLVLQNDKYEI